MTTIENSAIIDGHSVADVWAKLFLQLKNNPGDSLGPSMIRIQTENAEKMVEKDSFIRVEIDKHLKEAKKPLTRETSEIIFPYSVWRAKKWNIDELSNWYLGEFLPRLRAIAPSKFRRTYFERMIDFEEKGADNPDDEGNQLKFILERWKEKMEKGSHFRQSGLQVAIFDPARDHSKEPYMLFPCLQQIGLHFPSKDTLGLSAYYPTQVLIERAYGNYLGLCQLGVFLAQELGVKFTEFACFVGSPRLGWPNKTSLQSLVPICKKHLLNP